MTEYRKTEYRNTRYGRPGCKDAVWKKGGKITGKDSEIWRIDQFGNNISYEEYGKTTKYGWDIDHTIPKAKGGSDELCNLLPVHFSKNRAMGERMDEKDKVAFFNAIREKRGIIRNKMHKFNFEEGKYAFVKEIPSSKEELAKIIKIEKKNIIVQFVGINYYSNILPDISLFNDVFEKRNHN
jgi:hypothetical protein